MSALDLPKLSGELASIANSLDSRVLHFSWSYKREADRADFLLTLGDSIARTIRALADATDVAGEGDA